MRAPALIALCVVVAAGTAVGVQLWMHASETAAASPVAPEPGADVEEVAALRAELAAVRDGLEQLRAQPPAAPSARREIVDVEAAVLAVLREQGVVAGDAASGSSEAGEASDGEVTVDSLLALLESGDLDDQEWSDVWQRAQEAGITDELLAVFEERAKASPNDAEAQVELAYAYLGKLNQVPDMAKGKWATLADETFDSALEIDPNHWDARFTKAISLSFWPAFTGKPAEAVSQLEILVEKQRNLPRDPKHAQTYLMLGNLYQQQGRTEDAQAMWTTGAQLFPDNEELSSYLTGDGN